MPDDKTTDQQTVSSDDVEAHAIRPRGAPAEAADVEAHLARSGRRNEDGPPPEGTEREQPADRPDDVEGHAFRSGR